MSTRGKRMDNLDIEILRSLNVNARKSFRDIAKELKISLGTISNRIRKMQDEGIIMGYVPLINEEKIGYDISAIIGFRISRGKLLEVQKRIAKDDRVYGVYDVTGEWDSIVLARFRNRKELNDFIKRVLATEFVERTYTQVVLNIMKDERRVIV